MFSDDYDSGAEEVVVLKKPRQYIDMIASAIKLRTRQQMEDENVKPRNEGLVSLNFISRYIKQNYAVAPSRFKNQFSSVVYQALEDGFLTKTRNSVRLTPKFLGQRRKVAAAKKAKEEKKEKKEKKGKKGKSKDKKEKDEKPKRKRPAKEEDSKKPAKRQRKAKKEEDTEDEDTAPEEDSPKKKRGRQKKAAAEDEKEKPTRKKAKTAAEKRKAKAKAKEDATPKKKAPKKAPATKTTATPVKSDDLEVAAGEVRWHYQDRGWKQYDADADKMIESAYQEFLADPGGFDVRAVASGTWHYQVDFRNMQQTNVDHPAHTVRAIKRF